MSGPDVRELRLRADAFEKRLNQIKTELAAQGIAWYPYRTLANFSIFDKLLDGPRRHLLDLAGGDPILDIGCADGATSFFLETLGCQVLAVDNSYTNHNRLAGFQALKRAFRSSVTFQAVDLDSQFTLPDEVFGLAFFLGVLYHLKNPYYVLEALARRARFCLLSTRVAQRTPQGNPMEAEPLVYLLDPDECNQDSTNHWIFSAAALRRLLQQTGWTVHDFMTTGVTRGSEPARGDRDERAFCLLESRVCRRYSVKLLDGWYALENNSYRWTERRFAVELRRPPADKGASLRFNFRLVGPGPVTLAARVNGVALPEATFMGEGEHSYEVPISREAARHPPIRIDFSVDKSLAGGMDERELALLVAFWAEGKQEADPDLPFELR
jgi:tRNA (mo5U34)-methyltransferase